MLAGIFNAQREFVLSLEFLIAIEVTNYLTAFVYLIASLVFFLAARRHPDEKYLRYWAAWSSTYAASCIGYNIAAGFSTTASIIEIAALFIGVAGLRRFFDRPVPWKILAGTFLLYAGLLAAFYDPAYSGPNQMKSHLAYYITISIPSALLMRDVLRWYTGFLPGLGWLCALAIAAQTLVFLTGTVIYLMPYVSNITPTVANMWATYHTMAVLVAIAFVAFTMSWGNMLLFNERLYQRLAFLAETDTLTGLFNRRAFTTRAKKALTDVSTLPVSSVLLLDIDHFKSINDTYGHDAGDTVLSSFARLLGSTVPHEAIAARLGGEEFAVLLPGMTEVEAINIAERIRRATEDLIVEYGVDKLRFTISIGVALVQDADGLSRALSRADAALYDAKRNGRNRVAVSASGWGSVVWAEAG